jgi:hypothetical protein
VALDFLRELSYQDLINLENQRQWNQSQLSKLERQLLYSIYPIRTPAGDRVTVDTNYMNSLTNKASLKRSEDESSRQDEPSSKMGRRIHIPIGGKDLNYPINNDPSQPPVVVTKVPKEPVVYKQEVIYR